jgi:hypothetical protein
MRVRGSTDRSKPSGAGQREDLLRDGLYGAPPDLRVMTSNCPTPAANPGLIPAFLVAELPTEPAAAARALGLPVRRAYIASLLRRMP